MGSGGAILLGLLGFAMGGPIGGIIGAMLGNAMGEAELANEYETGETLNVHCPHCRSYITIKSAGVWMCPSCRRNLVYDGRGVFDADEYREGSSADKSFNSLSNDPGKSRQLFFIVTFSLLAKLAKADGRISREEIKVVENFIKTGLLLDSANREFAIEIFTEAKNSPYSFEEFAAQFYGMFSSKREILVSMLELLLVLAGSDGVYHPDEEKLILAAKEIFNINDYEYRSLCSRAGLHANSRKSAGAIKENSETTDCYAILGCKPQDDVDTIKTAYKKLAREYHPDAIMAKGLPEDFVKFATERFKQIQNAYEQVKKLKNF